MVRRTSCASRSESTRTPSATRSLQDSSENGNVTRGFSEILLDNPGIETGQRQEFLSIIVKESERLTRLINQVLDLAKIEAGRFEWQIGPVALEAAIDDAVASVGQIFKDRHVALNVTLPATLRPVLADRLALSLINLRQLQASDFEEFPGGAVYLNEAGRKTVLVAYQKRKEDEVDHRVIGKKTPLGLVPHVQARLLARHLRDDLEHYLPFLMR